MNTALANIEASLLLPVFERARQALAEAKTTNEVKLIRDQAQAIQAYLHQQRAGLGMQNDAAEIKLRAERRLGEMLAETVTVGNPQFQHDAGIGRVPEGISETQSYRWQQAAKLPAADFERLIQERKADNEELTSAFLLRASRQLLQRDTRTPPMPAGLFDVFLADPPWLYDNQIESWGPAAMHYPSMTLGELGGLKMPAADNATLFLWATNPFLFHALALAEQWGFTYKTNLVWVKTDLQKPGSGFYVRGRHELLLICTRGSHVPDQQGKPPIGSVIMAPVREHSQKPSEVYAIIEALYPDAHRLELFARGAKRDGWTTWGNEASD